MYRRLTLNRGMLRLTVILGSSGELVEHQLLVSMMALQFWWWTIPAIPLRLVSESKAKYELKFTLPRLAAWALHLMCFLYVQTGYHRFLPRVAILRDPDWLAKGKLEPLCFWLCQPEVEYQEPFPVVQAEDQVQAEGPPHPPEPVHLELVVDNGPHVEREPHEVDYDEIPWRFGGVSDINLEGERTQPMEIPSVLRKRPKPHCL